MSDSARGVSTRGALARSEFEWVLRDHGVSKIATISLNSARDLTADLRIGGRFREGNGKDLAGTAGVRLHKHLSFHGVQYFTVELSCQAVFFKMPGKRKGRAAGWDVAARY